MADYSIEHYSKQLDESIERLSDIIFGSEFKKQMSRFLPEEVQKKTLLSEKFLHLLLRETREMLQECRTQL